MMTEQDPFADLVPFSDFVKHIHASPRKGRRIIQAREIGVVRVGGTYLIPKSEIERFLAERFIPARDARRERTSEEVFATVDRIAPRRRVGDGGR